MRKRLIEKMTEPGETEPAEWLDIERHAEAHVTSEDPAHPIEAAFTAGERRGWRAAWPGEQTLRLAFDRPQRIRRIKLTFSEPSTARTHEFCLRASSDGGASYREIVRQQWTFSPPGTTREVEDYRVDLDGVTTLELVIVPNRNGGTVYATLDRWQIG